MNLKVYEIAYDETLTVDGTVAAQIVSYDVIFSDQGPQGIQGIQGIQGPTGTSALTNQGDILYRNATVPDRLPIGTAGQFLKVNTGATAPEWATITKSTVGLGNVDNTSDSNKPVSTATQAALDLKANLASPTFTGTVSGITKSMVGLGNVDNTSDANKPISSATQTALDGKASSAAAVPSGGTTGQVLRKKTNSNYDTEWGDESGGGGGVPTSRTISAGTGLTGGGDLSANRTLAVSYGTTAGTACQGNDGRISGIESGSTTISSATVEIANAGISIATADGTGELHTGDGGSISTNDGGGSIDTSMGGGAINTRGTGSIEFGIAGTRTTLTGTATADRAISLPDSDGTLIVQGGSSITTYNGDITIGDLGGYGGISGFGRTIDFEQNIISGFNVASSGSISGSGLTQATNRILGRTTASTGAVEEITVGGGASLSAGALTVHTQSHAITSTSDHTATANRVFYSNNSGQVTELALGAANTVLTSNGATSAPSFAAVSAGVTGVDATTADVFSVSGSNLVADDANKEDAFVMWDDSAGKLVHSAVLESIRPDQLPRLRCWLDADSSYITKDGSDNVSAWTDRASISNFSQATAARQPKWYAGSNATHAINSKPVVWFDGDNATSGNRDFLTRAAHLDLPSDFTAFVVMRLDATSTSANKIIFSDADSTATDLQCALYVNRGVSPSRYGVGHGKANAYTVQDYGANATGVHLLVFQRRGSANAVYSVRRNGIFLELITNVTALGTFVPPAADCGSTTVGRSGSEDSGYLNGDLAELVVYDTALTADQIVGVERYLSTKYNITLS